MGQRVGVRDFLQKEHESMPISERELLVPSLQLAARRPGGAISTTSLIESLADLLRPRGDDLKVLRGRRDSRFSQKVRNVISHHENSTSIFKRGLAERINGGIRITDLGRRFLRDEGH